MTYVTEKWGGPQAGWQAVQTMENVLLREWGGVIVMKKKIIQAAFRPKKNVLI